MKNTPRPSLALGFLAAALWIAATGICLAGLWRYSATPGENRNAPALWPADSSVKRQPGRATLVLFLHPRCPCSRATLAELRQLQSDAPAGFDVRVLLLRPEGTDEGWDRTALARAAAELPGATARPDFAGAEARRFHATTSGEILVYDPAGTLRFHGGITGARGHEGENAGLAAARSWLRDGLASLPTTPVYGCPLKNDGCAEDVCN